MTGTAETSDRQVKDWIIPQVAKSAPRTVKGGDTGSNPRWDYEARTGRDRSSAPLALPDALPNPLLEGDQRVAASGDQDPETGTGLALLVCGV
jgi:hypothetical protein